MKIVDSYAWSTHKPLLTSLVDVVDPGFILELGVGMHSTPIFLNSKCKDIIFVDSDDEWLEYVKKNNLFDDRHELIFHDLGPGKGRKIFPRDLTPEKRLQIVEYYKNLAVKVSSRPGIPKMLFVDNMTCCRTIAINTLYKSFDVIAYHDCEPLGITWYEYYFEEGIKNNFYHYTLVTPRSWTGCFINNRLEIGSLLENDIKQHILKYSAEINEDPVKIYLKKG